MPKQIIQSQNAPKAAGPYSQGVKANGFVFVSGQLGIDVKSGQMPPDIRRQTELALQNVLSVLEAAGACAHDVVKVTVFLKDLSHFDAVNEVYSSVFAENCPARCCIEVARLPRDAGVEIEAIAAL